MLLQGPADQLRAVDDVNISDWVSSSLKPAGGSYVGVSFRPCEAELARDGGLSLATWWQKPSCRAQKGMRKR